MTTLTRPDIRGHHAGTDRPSLARLTLVELRKLTDTRAGRWLLAAIVAVSLVMVVIQAVYADPADLNLETFLGVTLTPVGLLLPVLGILSVTSEWAQRSALTTFTLVPVRQRVLVAKLAAGAAAALVAVAASLVFAAAATLVSHPGGNGAWDLSPALLGNALLYELVYVLMGLGFGMLLLNSPLAIVLYFLLPTVWTMVRVEALRTVSDWLDLAITTQPLLSTSGLDGPQWQRLGTSIAFWVVLPLALGLVRVMRAEVK